MKNAPVLAARGSRIVFNPHFWIVVAMFVLGTILHYPELMALSPLYASLGLTRHAMERVLFLLPMAYAGFMFGIKAGLAGVGMALAIMLPRALLISSSPRDALFETSVVTIVGGLVNLWFEGYRKEKGRSEQALLRLAAAQKELQSYIQVVEADKKQLSTLNAISAILSQSLELESILNGAFEKVLETMNLKAEGGIFLVNAETQELVLTVQRGLSPEFAQQEARIAFGECLCGLVAQSGELLISEDCHRDARHTRQSKSDSHSHIIVPLKSKGNTLGVMFLYPQNQYHLNNQELQLLVAIGNQIGVAIENATLYKKERAMAEQLQTSEKNYRELFENANDAIWVQDLEGRITVANKASSELSGYPLEELIGMNVKEFLSSEGLRVAREVREKLLKGERFREPYEQEMTRRDGTTAVMKLTTNPVIRQGQIIGFQHIARDITKEKRMQDNLNFYLQQVTRAQEEERRRIARELHDETAQDLIALSRQLDLLISNRRRSRSADISLLEKVRQQTDRILEGIRRFSQDLRPSVLDDLGLLPALEWLTSDVSTNFGIAIDMEVVGSARRFSPEVELLLFRIAQEALRNVWKHSEASKAWVTLEFGEGKTILAIKDNGKGFELPERIGDLAAAGKLGLVGMEERARLIGGTLTVQSQPGKGSSVTVELPA